MEEAGDSIAVVGIGCNFPGGKRVQFGISVLTRFLIFCMLFIIFYQQIYHFKDVFLPHNVKTLLEDKLDYSNSNIIRLK